MDKKIKFKGFKNDFIKTCPVCGYSFRILDPTTKKAIKTCPMCDSKFTEPHVHPNGENEFEKRFF